MGQNKFVYKLYTKRVTRTSTLVTGLGGATHICRTSTLVTGFKEFETKKSPAEAGLLVGYLASAR
jgi:hypothetical protein